MKKSLLSALPAAAAFSLVVAFTGGAAGAASPDATTYAANLQPVPLNGSAGSGNITVKIDGNQAIVTEKVSGLADKLPDDTDTLAALGIPAAFAGKPYPHVQHVHIGGQGSCPAADADADGNGVIDTAEGVPTYGSVGTTLSVKGSTAATAATDVTIAPSGASYTYSRTFTMNADTLASVKAGKGVAVVHGLNPATAPKASTTTPSSLGVQLDGADKPLAMIATAPALCGSLKAEATNPSTATPQTTPQTTAPQMNAMPSGGAQTGGGSTSGMQDGALLGLGALLVTGAGIVLVTRRRIADES